MDPYIDPPDSKEIIDRLDSINDKTEFQQYVQHILPHWLIYTIDKYSSDYPHLQENWIKLCQINKVRPQKIVLVADIQFDENHQVVQKCCEIMTKRGYVVRRASEFVVCPVCNKAIPCKPLWELLRNHQAKHIPVNWSEKCTTHL